MIFGKKKEILPTIYTEQVCGRCGEKERRPFEQGDYVFRQGVRCKKCDSADTTISAVYGEYPPEKNA